MVPPARKNVQTRLTGFGAPRAGRPDFAALKASVDLAEVVRRGGIELKAEGKDLVGLCPFHEDTRPSLRVTPAKGLFRCMSCGAAGNVIQFVAKREGLTEREAALKLCGSIPGVKRASELAGAADAAPPLAPSAVSPELDEATRARLLARVAAFYARTHGKDRAGLDYLKTRGLDDPALLEAFGVGYCNGSMREALPRAGELVEQLKALGVLNEKGNEVFYGRVVVPLCDAAGNVVSLYGRRLGDEEPRHLFLRGERRGVFGGTTLAAGEPVFLVEAVLDALSLWAAGWRNVIALGGVDGWREEHAELFRARGVREVFLALDGDAAGAAGVQRLRSLLAALGVVTHRVVWPEGVKDANAFFARHPAQDFAALLQAAHPQRTESSGGEAQRLEKERVESRADGLTVCFGGGEKGRRYELCAIEKPSASRLRATVRALAETPGRFVIDTIDFFALRSKRAFSAEAARLFRESVETIETDVNALTLAAEEYVARRASGTLAPAAVDAATAAQRTEGVRFGKSADLVDEIQRDLEKLGIIGERTNRLLLYLAMTSRKMDEPLAVQILSSSGAGKSHLQDAVLSLCPTEDLIKLTSLSGQALFYKGEDSLRHKCLAIAEVAGAEGARYALRNLISERKLVIETTIKNALTGRLETQANTVHGPTAVFETTTNPDTDPETKSRYLLLSVDESPEQTQAILAAQRQSHTLEGRKRRQQREAILQRQHAFQRALRPLVVVNPFEPLLTYGDGRLLFRRDHPKYLNLILAVTFLHQHQRAVRNDAELGDYIETTLEDVAIANELAAELFGASLDELSFPSRQLLRLLGDYVARQAAATQQPAEKIEWTRRELREAIQWTEARLRLHLGELVRLEYVAPLGGKWGALFKYRLLVEREEIEGGRFAPGVKDLATLRHEAQAAGIGHFASVYPHFASEPGNFAGTSQPPSCEVVAPAEPHQHKANGYHAPHFASLGPVRTGSVCVNGAHNGSDGEAALATAGERK